VNPVVTTTSSSTSRSVFKKGLCPQSYVQTDDVYVLQTINKVAGLPKSYIPKNLVDIRSHIGVSGGNLICLTDSVATSLYQMSQDMEKENLRLMVVSGYRSFNGQQLLYNAYAPVMNSGAYHRVAPAGHSEHQLGTTVDIASEFKSGTNFALTDESLWIKENAYKYGFITSYEEGTEEKTGYMYEPWHIRYVGIANATLLRKGNYSLAYKPMYYKKSWVNNLLGRLRDFIQVENSNDTSIGG
jgi:LAS superfamily LD-carboxypeptidase LdcB